jgi:hypothetical protein
MNSYSVEIDRTNKILTKGVYYAYETCPKTFLGGIHKVHLVTRIPVCHQGSYSQGECKNVIILDGHGQAQTPLEACDTAW